MSKMITVGNAKKKFRWGNKAIVWLMMLPGLVYLFINNYMPMYGITIAFKAPDFSLDSLFDSPWNHFENFQFLFETDEIWLYVRNTVLYSVTFLVLNIIIPVTMAILFTNIRGKRLKGLYQTVILLPYLMSWVVVSYIAFALFSGENGMINALISSNGGTKINFYGADAKWAWPFILTFFNMWKGVGFSFLFYYSACLAISPSLYEAAKLDGASYWKQVWHVTLPGIKPVVITMFILGLGSLVRSDYGLFYLVTKNSGQLYEVTQTIDTYVFNALKNDGNIAMSSAASVLQSLVGFVMIVAANLILKKVSPENAMF